MAVAAGKALYHGAGTDVKTQFCTKEGVYKQLKLSEYSRPLRSLNNASNMIPVRLSFVTIKRGNEADYDEKIAFNVGRDMFFYNFCGTKKAPDLNHPIDRRTYKGPQPTCHDINLMTRTPTSIDMLIGFTAGQIQLMDPLSHECRKCFNDERTVDKGLVTCVKWIPGSETRFLVSYNNPNIYLYDKDLPAMTTEPNLDVIKRGHDYAIEVCKNRQDCNPLCRWRVGRGGVNELAFSPDCKSLAMVSQDGYLRVFDYEKQDLLGSMRSLFGGLRCVCWSPDGKYIATGGEDDLITIWSCLEQRVIARGEGHHSWVNVVSFDPFTTHVGDRRFADSDSEDDATESRRHRTKSASHRTDASDAVSYRVGSVGEDTLLILWDIGEDVLRPQKVRSRSARTSTLCNSVVQPQWTYANSTMRPSSVKSDRLPSSNSEQSHATGIKYHTLNRFTSKHQNSVSSYVPVVEMDDLLLGTPLCPRLTETEKLDPLVAKKIANDRISALVFREDCIVTATYEGFINVWERPEQTRSQDGSTIIQ